MKQTITQTHSTTTTQIAVATLALFAVSGIALAVIPAVPQNQGKVFLNPTKSVQSLAVSTPCKNGRYNVAELICKGGKIRSNMKGCRSVAQIKTAAENYCVKKVVADKKPAPQGQTGYGYGYNPIPPENVNNPAVVASGTNHIARGPNYMVDLTSIFGLGFRGSNFVYSIRFTNTGDEPIPATGLIPGSNGAVNNGVKIVFLDQNLQIVGHQSYANIQGIPSGGSYVQNYSEPRFPTSSRYIQVQVDSFNVLRETNESDNIVAIPIPENSENDPQVR